MVGMRERCTLTAKATPMLLCTNKGVARPSMRCYIATVQYASLSLSFSLPCLSTLQVPSMGNTRISFELRVPFSDRL